jgi:hypothetical protein
MTEAFSTGHWVKSLKPVRGRHRVDIVDGGASRQAIDKQTFCSLFSVPGFSAFLPMFDRSCIDQIIAPTVPAALLGRHAS